MIVQPANNNGAGPDNGAATGAFPFIVGGAGGAGITTTTR
ncbi:unnamed protein product, partial [Rotaria sordida]